MARIYSGRRRVLIGYSMLLACFFRVNLGTQFIILPNISQMKQISRITFIAFTLFFFIYGVFAHAEAAKPTANFTVKDIQGVKHTLANYKGKWVLVNYWATWCPPCLEEVPDLINLHENRRKKDVVVIGVVFDYADLKEVTDYVDDMLMTYPIVLSDNAVNSQFESVSVLPTTFIFNPEGKLVKIKHGAITKQYVEKFIGPDI